MRKILNFSGGTTGASRFERLVQPHIEVLYGAAYRFTASQSDAEDLVQEVCLKAYLKLNELEQMEYQRAWLLRVLYNLFIDEQRKNRRAPLASEHVSNDIAPADIAAGRQWQPEEQVDRMMRTDNIVAAMKLLDKDQCTLLVLHDVDGYGLKELQSLSGLPLGTLKSQLHRTRAKLGRLLKNDAVIQRKLNIVGNTT